MQVTDWICGLFFLFAVLALAGVLRSQGIKNGLPLTSRGATIWVIVFSILALVSFILGIVQATK